MLPAPMTPILVICVKLFLPFFDGNDHGSTEGQNHGKGQMQKDGVFPFFRVPVTKGFGLAERDGIVVFA